MMKRLWLFSLLLFIPTTAAMAQPGQQSIEGLIANSPVLAAPPSSFDSVPVLRNRRLYRVPLTTVQTVSLRTIQEFGAVCDGTNPDSAAWAAAVAWANTNAGIIQLPAGKSCGVNATIALTASRSGLVCESEGASSDVVGGPGCEMKWLGSSGGRMVSFVAPTVNASSKRILNNIVRGIRFNGNAGLAADAIYVAGVLNTDLDSLTFTGFNGGNIIYIDSVSVASGPTWGDATSSQYMRVSNILINNTGSFTSNGLKLGANVVANGNASYNTFYDMSINVGNTATGILCDGCDNNVFFHTGIAGGATAIDFAIVNSGGTFLSASSNIFYHIGFLSPVIARGQTSVPTCTAFSYGVSATCTWGNILNFVDKANPSNLPPTVEPGAQISWSDTSGRQYGNNYFVGMGNLQTGLLAIYNPGGTNICGNSAQANAAGEAVYMCGGIGPYTTFDNNNGTRFSIRMGSVGAADDNLIFQRMAGTGKLEFVTDVQLDQSIRQQTGIADIIPSDTCAGKPTGTLYNNSGVAAFCP